VALNSEQYQRTYDQGLTALRQGDISEAISHFRLAAAYAMDDAQAADALSMLGRAYSTQGEHLQAEEPLREALRRATGSPGALARAKMAMGIVRWQTGQLDAAKYFLQEAEQELNRHGDVRSRSSALGNLGVVLLARGEYQEAIVAMRTSIELCEALNDLVGVSIQCSNLGEAYLELGDAPSAQPLHERAIRLAELLGSESMQADALRNLGMDLALQNQPAEGLAMIEHALEIARNTHQQDIVLQCQASLADVLLHTGELEAARTIALELQSTSVNVPMRQAQARLILGQVQLARRESQRALLTLESGLVDAQVSASKMLVLRLHAALSQVGFHPAIAQVHRRIAADLLRQIAASLEDPELRARFTASELYRSVLG
jgi:tetratricopeptide (TPR) repeat protein